MRQTHVTKVVRVPALRVAVVSASGTLGAGWTQSCQVTRYPEDWRDSVLLGPEVPYGLAVLSLFRPPGTLGTGGTRSF